MHVVMYLCMHQIVYSHTHTHTHAHTHTYTHTHMDQESIPSALFQSDEVGTWVSENVKKILQATEEEQVEAKKEKKEKKKV